MEVSCQFSTQCNYSGGSVNAVISSFNTSNTTTLSSAVVASSSSSATNQKILVHASGFFQADPRWIRSSTSQSLSKIFIKQVNTPLDGIVKIPRSLPGGDNTHCIFVTTKRELFSSKSLIQFDLPNDLLPSFKGLLANITYFVTITVITDTGNNGETEDSMYHFPFNVLGKGSISIPQYIRSSSVIAQPLASFPSEHCFLPTIAGSSSSSASNDPYKSSPKNSNNNQQYNRDGIIQYGANTYTVRDEGLVCIVTTLTAKYPGDLLNVVVDFEKSEQICNTIRVRLIMSELRSDGSHVQDKYISSAQKNTKDALVIQLGMKIGTDCPCSFQTPLLQVTYRLEFEFFADTSLIEKQINSNNDNNNDINNKIENGDVFTWSLDFNVVPRIPESNDRANLISCLQPSAFNLRHIMN